MTPEEREQKLSLVGQHAKRINEHLRVTPDWATADAAVTLVQRGKAKPPEPPAEPKPAPVAPAKPKSASTDAERREVVALKRELTDIGRSLLKDVRAAKAALGE